MIRRVLVAAGAAFLVVTLGGCDRDPAPPPTSSVSKATTRPSLPTQAPAVTGGMIDLHRYIAKPCSLLTAEQRKKLGGIEQTFEGGDGEGGDEGDCVWDSAGIHLYVITYVVGDPLAEVYTKRNDQRYHEYFEPITVGGLPAVQTAIRKPPLYMCDVYVGTGHGQGLRMEAARQGDDPPDLDWCGYVTDVAEAMVATARG